MSRNSRASYHHIKDELGCLELLILDELNVCGASLPDLRDRLNIRHQTLSGRLSKMHDEGLVYINHNGEYRVTPNEMREEVIFKREEQKFRRWVEIGNRNEWHFRNEAAEFVKAIEEDECINGIKKQKA